MRLRTPAAIALVWALLLTRMTHNASFATVRHRTIRTKGRLSNEMAIAMVFKLLEAAQRSWRRLDGTNFLPKVIYGVVRCRDFKGGSFHEPTATS
jgi:hypothetical protein